MSKSTIKKLLQSMTKEDIIEMVLELYSARKEAKEYLEFYASPDEKGKLEEYKSIIREEFYPKKRREPQTRFPFAEKPWQTSRSSNRPQMPLRNLWFPTWNGQPSSPMTMEICGNSITILLKAISKRPLSSLSLMDCGKSILKGFNSALNGRTDVVMALQMPWPTCMRMAMLCIKTLQGNNPTTQMSDVEIKKMFGK